MELILIRQIKRLFQDYLGIALIRGWIRIADDSVTHIKMDDVKDILRLYSNTFKGLQTGQITKYTSMFQDISYIICESGKIVGYCLYYLKPEIRSNGLRKIAVIYSIAVDEEFRKRNNGEKLLLHSINEMRLNKIDYIRLYVDEYNASALNLYTRLGFRIIGRLKNICGYGHNCYEMQLKL